MVRTSALGLCACLGLVASGPASAQVQISIPLFAGDASDVTTMRYKCSAGGDFVAQFINTPYNKLALVTLDKDTRVFVGVISGSGARYAAGALELWTKGDTATMTNVMENGTSQDCVAEEPVPG